MSGLPFAYEVEVFSHVDNVDYSIGLEYIHFLKENMISGAHSLN